MAESAEGDIFEPGHLLNNTYRIDRLLGRGGTSEVYKARNDISGRFVAIKVLKSEFAGDEAFVTLMRREEEIREIRHDAVVRYSENHRTPDGLIYLVMDYVEGPGLDLLLRQGGLPAGDLVRVCRRVADGLKVAHARRIIHRDLSPDNIILRGGNPDEAVIIDFGIAKDANPGAKTIVGNDFAGKYAYAAPEQLSGNTDTRSDLYALGALLLATFRGKRPDPGKNPMEVLQNKQKPLDTSGVPEPLKGLIDRMSHPDPFARFQSADELVRAIDAGAALPEATVLTPRTVVPGFTAQPPPVSPKPALPSTTTRTGAVATQTPSRTGLWIGLAALALIAAGVAVYLSGVLTGPPTPANPGTIAQSATPAVSLPKDATQQTDPVPQPSPPPKDIPKVPAPEVPKPQPEAAQTEAPAPKPAETAAPKPQTTKPATEPTAPTVPQTVTPQTPATPVLPVADPYLLTIERPQTGPVLAIGSVPAQDIADQLTQAVQKLGGTANLSLASGPIGNTWGADVVRLVQALGPVDSWRIAITDNQAEVRGTTSDALVQKSVMAALDKPPGVLKVTVRIDLVPKPVMFLTPDVLAPALAAHADCGPLALLAPPTLGYGMGDTVTVTGRLAHTQTQVKLFEALSALAPDRKVDLRIDLLNPALCQIETALPAAAEGGFSFDFGYGDTAGLNASGRYFVGENPVIDLVIPPEVTEGFVSVSIIDVSGNVYHLLPNLNRPDNAVASLRKGVSGPVRVRIAYPLSDNTDPAHVAFVVDATSLGKSKVVVIHSAKPLFPQLRPTTESVGGFADGLKAEVEAGSLQILSLDSRILTSIAR